MFAFCLFLMVGEMGEALRNVGGGQVGGAPGRKPKNNEKKCRFSEISTEVLQQC